MDTIETLKAARELLTRPGGWCQGALWRDAGGRTILAGPAISFCLMGAAAYVAEGPEDLQEPIMALLNVIQDKYDVYGIAPFNDAPERTLADVLIVVDLAIDRAVGES